MLRRSAMLIAVVACLAAFGVSGCGSKSNSSASGGSAAVATTHFAKTKFLLHAGLAFGAFHHFIYEPIKAGDLKHPFSHKFTLIKAGVAALFVVHELKLAAVDVKSSKILSTLFAPLTFVANKLSALKSSIVGGSANPSDVTNLNGSLSQISSTAASHGQSISDAIPSASQLASGG
jgi:hypothetical protein